MTGGKGSKDSDSEMSARNAGPTRALPKMAHQEEIENSVGIFEAHHKFKLDENQEPAFNIDKRLITFGNG